MAPEFYIPVLTFIAGFIDAIAGGGGLITVPAWTMALGPGAHVIATNKVGALFGALMALAVYSRRHRLPWREGGWFLVAIVAGGFSGSQLTSHIPAHVFGYLLFALCPMVLWLVWSKEKLFADRPSRVAPRSRFMLAGYLVGVYDGFFGPGGGTFMLLALLMLTHLPLMEALALSKLANALAALSGLTGFAINGHILWGWGIFGGVCMMAGAFLGAHYTSRQSVKVVRPALTVVVALLMGKLAWDYLL
jgi:uncharacterized membrane protein YfcA